MALIPKIKLCLESNCSVLKIFETTGAYDVTTNQGGYGAENNVGTGDVNNGNLKITDPEGEEYNIELNIASENPSYYIELDISSELGRESIEDGLWKFEYSFFGPNDDQYFATVQYFFYCNIECCVSKLLNKVDVFVDKITENNKNKIDTYMIAKTMLEALKGAASCYNISEFNNIKEFLTKICRNSNCKTCN